MAAPDSQLGTVLRYIACKGNTNDETLANMAALFRRPMNPITAVRKDNPYYVQQTPLGSVVICGEHLITDEVKRGEAEALARALNMEHQTRMLLR